MKTLAEIKEAVEKLPREEFFELARRLSAGYPDLWRKQIARDAESGKFGLLSAEIDGELARGEIRPL